MIDRTRVTLLIVIFAVASGEIYVASTIFRSEALPEACAGAAPTLDIEPITLFPPPLPNGKQAPDFNLTDTDGNAVTLTDLRGKTVILNFMATWCQQCIWETSDLVELHSMYSNNNTLFLSIAIEPFGTVQDVIEFKSQYCAEWSYALDDKNTFTSYNVNVLPTTYIIDPSSTIAYGHVGILDKTEFSIILNELGRQ